MGVCSRNRRGKAENALKRNRVKIPGLLSDLLENTLCGSQPWAATPRGRATHTGSTGCCCLREEGWLSYGEANLFPRELGFLQSLSFAPHLWLACQGEACAPSAAPCHCPQFSPDSSCQHPCFQRASSALLSTLLPPLCNSASATGWVAGKRLSATLTPSTTNLKSITKNTGTGYC